MQKPELDIIIEGRVSEFDLSYEWVQELEELTNLEKRILFHEFENALKEKNFEYEYRILKRITNTNKHVDKMVKEQYQKLQSKNRYSYTIPFKHSRIVCHCEQEEIGFSGICDNEDLEYKNELNSLKLSKRGSTTFEIERIKSIKKFNQISKHKNSDDLLDLIPQPKTSIEIDNSHTDFYINACRINDPFLKNSPNQFIITQHPKSNTIKDFWHMILEQKIEVMIMLNS